MSAKNIPIAWIDGVPTVTAQEYAARRAKLFDKLPDNSAVIVVSAAEVLRNGSDNTYTYRQRSDALYLSGFPEANSVIVLTKKGQGKARRQQFTLFVSRQDRASELWHGKRVGIEGARDDFGADRAYSITTLGGNLRKLLATGIEQVFFARGADSKLEARVAVVLKKLGRRELNSNLLDDLRLVKSEAELAIMSRSAQIAAFAHQLAMRSCAPGLAESDLKAEIEYVFTANGNACPSYDTIVAAGVNGLSLHHPAGRTPLADGDLVLIDAGCEVSGYASDITRTFPVNGRFSTAQREIYELVLAGQLAAIDAVKVGASLADLDKACSDVLKQGLKTLGFPLGKTSAKKIALHELFPHGLGHWLGLDVHDVGDAEILVPGMVLTIEPGLYLGKDDERIPKQYRGIAVRIEDDVVVREHGGEILSRDAVKTVAGIEALMAGL
ncbi:MAG: aminopeptidase P N-terminal domain-containing protein [Cyanobacteria bacterium REEB67]|nr:aminopeptidase P N-terminal domain-containing protein [Cyanobacteria bacterium REEB67]